MIHPASMATLHRRQHSFLGEVFLHHKPYSSLIHSKHLLKLNLISGSLILFALDRRITDLQILTNSIDGEAVITEKKGLPKKVIFRKNSNFSRNQKATGIFCGGKMDPHWQSIVKRQRISAEVVTVAPSR